jgi:hypothetical protein
MCDVSTLKKYLTRPSPPRPANDSPCRGKTYIGNDGNMWQSKMTSGSVYRWVKVGGSSKSIVSSKKSGERKVKKSGERKVKKSGERKVKKSGERKVKKSGERKVKKSTYTISFPLVYHHEEGKKPATEQLRAFYKKESLKEVKNDLTDYYIRNDDDPVRKSASNFRISPSGVISFTVSRNIPLKEVEKFVYDYITHTSLADGQWEAAPGTGLVYGNNNNFGVIGYGKAKIV